MTQPHERARTSVTEARHLIEFRWFAERPNQAMARAMLDQVISEIIPGTAITDIDATDPSVARDHRFPATPPCDVTIPVIGATRGPGFRGLAVRSPSR